MEDSARRRRYAEPALGTLIFLVSGKQPVCAAAFAFRLMERMKDEVKAGLIVRKIPL